MGEDPQLVIISGRSGSGKSTALHVLEDAGYYCIDNLPAGLLPQLVAQAIASGEQSLRRIATGIDARNLSSDLKDFANILARLPETVVARVVYLDAADDILLRRFSETRRRHPLTHDLRSLPEALAEERRLLQNIADSASLNVDTSQLTVHELRDRINRSIVNDSEGMALTIESFAYRHGLPPQADIVFDVRCLPNPHWVEALREQTGRDRGVIEYLDGEAEVVAMLDDLRAYLERWLPRFAGTNRSYITVAVGCTGGQHRSVFVSERLYAHFRDRFPVVQLRHRELEAPRAPGG